MNRALAVVEWPNWSIPLMNKENLCPGHAVTCVNVCKSLTSCCCILFHAIVISYELTVEFLETICFAAVPIENASFLLST